MENAWERRENPLLEQDSLIRRGRKFEEALGSLWRTVSNDFAMDVYRG